MKIYYPTDLQKLNIAASCIRRGNPEQKAIWRIDAPCSILTKGSEIVAIRIDGVDWQPHEMPDFNSYFEARECLYFDKEFPIENVKYRYWPAAFSFDIGLVSGYEFLANEYCRGVNGKILKGYANRINARYIN